MYDKSIFRSLYHKRYKRLLEEPIETHGRVVTIWILSKESIERAIIKDMLIQSNSTDIEEDFNDVRYHYWPKCLQDD